LYLSSTKIVVRGRFFPTFDLFQTVNVSFLFFHAFQIDFPVFLTLDKKDLLEIGLTDEADMEKILKTIKTYMNTSANCLRVA
jgi:hypothetical protein